MLRSVVVPLDGTTFGERALPTAIAVAEAYQAALHLVRVHMVTPPGVYLDGLTPFAFQSVPDSTLQHESELELEEAAYLEGIVRQLGGRVRVTSSEVRLGAGIKTELEQAVVEWGADLVVMSTHAREGVAGIVFRSIGEALVRDLGLPTVLVPAAASAPWRPRGAPAQILITLDGSALAEAIIPPTVLLARAFGTPITLLGVEATHGRLAEYLHRKSEEMVLLGHTTTSARVIHSLDPAAAIVDFVNDNPVDLIAMATHGRTGLSKLLLGSVAERVLHTSHKPVLLLRPEMTADAVSGRAAWWRKQSTPAHRG